MGTRISFVIFLSLLMIGCSNSNDDGNNEENPTIAGEWSLTNISGGLEEIDVDFEKGTIIWDFDESNQMITVTNTITDTTVNTFRPSGTYSYFIENIEEVERVILEETYIGDLTLDLVKFRIDEQFRDGFQYNFER